MQADEYSAADGARQRLAPKSRFRLLSSLSDLRRRVKSTKSKHSNSEEDFGHVFGSADDSELTEARPSTGTANTVIDLDCSAISDLHEEFEKDVYKWAVIYENQRGCVLMYYIIVQNALQFLFRITIFSTAYYSGLSLLPSDPPPFTVPSSSPKRSKQPKVSLNEYPLPDGTWRWVSKSWMIDMRSDSGEVQHDGFEYNSRFRQNNWNSDVGTLNTGGWVRRRRWVRLMMRPARAIEVVVQNSVPGTPQTGHSVNSNLSEISNDATDLDAKDVWSGDDVEQNWIRCHKLMKHLGRDGRKLELWKEWVGGYYSKHPHLGHLLEKGKQVQKQWMEDDKLLPSQIGPQTKKQAGTNEGTLSTLKNVAAVLRIHVSFIFPQEMSPSHQYHSFHRATASSTHLFIPNRERSFSSYWDTQDYFLR